MRDLTGSTRGARCHKGHGPSSHLAANPCFVVSAHHSLSQRANFALTARGAPSWCRGGRRRGRDGDRRRSTSSRADRYPPGSTQDSRNGPKVDELGLRTGVHSSSPRACHSQLSDTYHPRRAVSMRLGYVLGRTPGAPRTLELAAVKRIIRSIRALPGTYVSSGPHQPLTRIEDRHGRRRNTVGDARQGVQIHGPPNDRDCGGAGAGVDRDHRGAGFRGWGWRLNAADDRCSEEVWFAEYGAALDLHLGLPDPRLNTPSVRAHDHCVRREDPGHRMGVWRLPR